MREVPDEIERWHIRGRYYGLTLVSTPTSTHLELDDLGPGIGRGPVAMASCDDDSGELTVQFFTASQLPLRLVEQFAREARSVLPPRV